ncbi:nudix hydrolase 10 isoform X1 [Populus alba]|uniref:nudix hydrolase 10 isoform X1 n=1 Tax=Populus alba TaxID=43335 RepID=UPI0015892539|nr:nudix hydrolase 10-like isoform X2 [Populus alba]
MNLCLVGCGFRDHCRVQHAMAGSMTVSVNSTPPVDLYANGTVHHSELLPASDDDHGGIIVDMKEPMDPDIFHAKLRASLSLWGQQGKKGIWIKLPIALVNLVETAVKKGFQYHHAEPNYLMLVYWIPDTPSTIPANASHRVGVGAIVLNDKREVLVVQEKSGIFQGKGVWKIPTGAVDEGEEIFMAAIREVKEETAIDTEFLEILAFRQWHKSFFEKSDLVFLCMLRPLSFDIQKQDLEIEAAQVIPGSVMWQHLIHDNWMPFEEYAAQPVAQNHELFTYIIDLCLAKVDRDYIGFAPQPLRSTHDDQISYLYSNARDLNQSSSADRQ